MALTRDGVESRLHDFHRAWVFGWVKFIRPKRFSEAGDLMGYLTKLAGEGKKGWRDKEGKDEGGAEGKWIFFPKNQKELG